MIEQKVFIRYIRSSPPEGRGDKEFNMSKVIKRVDPQVVLNVLRAMNKAHGGGGNSIWPSLEEFMKRNHSYQYQACMKYVAYETILEAAQATQETLTQVEDCLTAAAESDVEAGSIHWLFCSRTELIQPALRACGGDLLSWPYISLLVVKALGWSFKHPGVWVAGEIFAPHAVGEVIGLPAMEVLSKKLIELEDLRKQVGPLKDEIEKLQKQFETQKAEFGEKWAEMLEESARIRNQAELSGQKRRAAEVEPKLDEIFQDFPLWNYQVSYNNGSPYIVFGVVPMSGRAVLRLPYVKSCDFSERLVADEVIEAKVLIERVNTALRDHNFTSCRVKTAGKHAPAFERATGSIQRGSSAVFAFYFDAPAKLQ